MIFPLVTVCDGALPQPLHGERKTGFPRLCEIRRGLPEQRRASGCFILCSSRKATVQR